MASAALRILLTLSLLLAMTPRQVFGIPCCCAPVKKNTPSQNKTAKTCACSKCKGAGSARTTGSKSTAAAKSTIPEAPDRPCSSRCAEWCCNGAGFVPLTVITPQAVPEPATDPALPPVASTPEDGFRPRIEHPPRHTS